MIRLFKILILAFIIAPSLLPAQQELKLEDMLPPYLLDAVILKNGHFYAKTSYLNPSDDPKSLIYSEDGGGITPPNFTSHVHLMIDGIIFQLPFEEDPTTEMPPPQNPLTVSTLFRDTLNGIPRINSELIADMPDGEEVRFIFSMEPSKRPSGGFIKMSVAADTSSKAHDVGVLLLIDTKIGDNDRAPIVTSNGYYNTEQQFTNAVGSIMPEFWLALEGSTVQPGLTARGNLQEQGLIAPDFFMFGNWADYTAQSTVKGLGKFLWKDRNADNTLTYTDSAVLLIWDEERVGAGQKKVLASTEIGIVDSLEVVDAGSTTGGGQSAGAGDGIFYARPDGCVPFDTLHQVDCNDPNYHPYYPDTLDVLFIITNTKDNTFNNVRIEVDALPAGLHTESSLNSITPDLLVENTSAVGVVSFFADPRLYNADLKVPIRLMGNVDDTLAVDELCVSVPGILSRDSIPDMDFGLVCPSTADTAAARIFLKDVRCRDVVDIYIEGNAPDVGYFSIAQALPGTLPPNVATPLDIHFQPGALGNFQANLIVEIIDYDGFPGGDTLIVRDTAVISGTGEDEKFHLADATDTLDLGAICIGDTAMFEWAILNRGGCDVTIQDYNFYRNTLNQYSLANANDYPLVIPKRDDGSIGRAMIQFIPNTPGSDTTLLVIESQSTPGFDTLVVIGRGDLPIFEVQQTEVDYDTICPRTKYPFSLELDNPTACVVDIDTVIITSTSDAFTVNPVKFSIPSEGSANANIVAEFTNEGEYSGSVTIRTSTGFEITRDIKAVVVTRSLETELIKPFLDVRVGSSSILPATVTSTGSAGVEIDEIRVRGVHSNDYTVILPAGVNYPIYLNPGEFQTFDIEFIPQDVENRSAFIDYIMNDDAICEDPENTELTGRGFRPVINMRENSIFLGEVCIGESVDTVTVIRNFGNGDLDVTSAIESGDGNIDVTAGLPMTIPVDQSEDVDINFTPVGIGDFEKKIYFESNGDWLAEADTLLIRGRGVVCADIFVESVIGVVGTDVNIPIRIVPKEGTGISTQDIAQIMNDANKTGIDFTISHNYKITRFNDTPINEGFIAGNENLTISMDDINVTSNGVLNQDGVLAVLNAEVLLGDDFETPLEIEVDNFADGYSIVNTRDGKLVAEYCSFDKRLIDATNANGLIFNIRPNPINNTGYFELYLKQQREVNINVYDNLGTQITTISKNLSEGPHLVQFDANDFNSGNYYVVVQSGDILYHSRMVIVK